MGHGALKQRQSYDTKLGEYVKLESKKKGKKKRKKRVEVMGLKSLIDLVNAPLKTNCAHTLLRKTHKKKAS